MILNICISKILGLPRYLWHLPSSLFLDRRRWYQNQNSKPCVECGFMLLFNAPLACEALDILFYIETVVYMCCVWCIFLSIFEYVGFHGWLCWYFLIYPLMKMFLTSLCVHAKKSKLWRWQVVSSNFLLMALHLFFLAAGLLLPWWA